MKGYMKFNLASKPNISYQGDWANGAKRQQLMSKPRKYKMTFHLVNDIGAKAVETYDSTDKIEPQDLSRVVFELGVQMAEQYPDMLIDYGNSYVVIRA